MPSASRTINNLQLTIDKNVTCQMSHVKCQRKPNGFTLIEVLLFLLLVLAMVSVLLASTGSLRHFRNTNLTSLAAGIATCEIERLRDLAYTSLPANGTSPIGAPCNSDLAKLHAPSSANLTLADYGSPSDPDIKQITIVVSWTESGVADSIQMDTLKSKYEI